MVPLAKLGFAVTGIDTSGFALRRAMKHASAEGVRARFIRGDLLGVLQAQPERYDIVLCAEVLYLCPQYRAMLQVLARAVRPGGLLCVSNRPTFYYFVESLRHGDVGAARLVLTEREGHFRGPFPEAGYYNWQDEDDLRRLYQELGFKDVAVYPIDRFAWLAGLDVGTLGPALHREWLSRELETPLEGGLCARYGFVIAARDR